MFIKQYGKKAECFHLMPLSQQTPGGDTYAGISLRSCGFGSRALQGSEYCNKAGQMNFLVSNSYKKLCLH